MIHGYDIAGYQPENFPTAGIDFVIIKITEGTTYTNPNWVGQRATARAHSLVQGFYHFVRPGSMSAQADFFLSKISLQPGDILALDWEDNGVSSAQKDAWIRYVQAKTPGHKVILYCNLSFWKSLDTSGFAGDGLWIADPSAPTGQPRIAADWIMHQYGDSGGYDLDVAQFDNRAALSAWAKGDETDMTAVDLTNAGADLVGTRFLARTMDDPTTADGSVKSLNGVIWDTGKNAFWSYNATQEIKQAVAALASKIDTVNTKLTALSTTVSGIDAKLDTLQTAVTDPSGLINAIRDELNSFKLVFEQTPEA